MTTDQLVNEIMLDKLSNLNPDVESNQDTVLEDVLSSDSQMGSSNSMNVFEDLVKSDLHNNGVEVKPWPDNWRKLSVKGLAEKLLILIFILFGLSASSQLTVNFSAIKTQLKNNALQFGVSYIRNVDSLYGGKSGIVYGKHSVFAFTPTFDIESGTGDAMSSINAKLTGLLISYKQKTTSSGLVVSDISRTFSTFPFSTVVETNNKFNFINALLEAGYVPWFTGKNNPSILRHTRLGIFLQAGYKFKLDTTGNSTIGGGQDQSQESFNSALLRIKSSVSVDTKKLIQIGLLKCGLVGNADVWFDIVNGAVYHKLQGIFRVYLTDNDYIDMQFQHGSGAPNFNQGDQWGIGATITF